MKVSGPLTHARYAAELARIVRIASKVVAHETLRMHEGAFAPDIPMYQPDAEAVCKQIETVLKDIRGQ